ncbi:MULTISPECIES: SGNH/GDSL hydrolase family protein [unclassified Leptolyngbya]|uniref:SGNH/GDSL hydrolase family protein n=1 Tax=unclassified Leptolyngbya TaxID=2650499 RepID=UPI001686ABD3|nr:SGNH/GDSL hydrolase family protein [Leptolyngbya sp. FACHB-8]MBD2157618.1 SGNH/GDSL hydrolase family protein [Leptolyngbya sp. FACHB-16]
MRKFSTAIALTLLTFILAISCTPRSGVTINEIIAFGDSLSDVGQVFQSSGGLYPPDPPYFHGRYSNGQVWVEYLASDLDLADNQTQNFAWGGATTQGGGDSPVPGLRQQVSTFTQAQQRLNPNALYVVWAGANDYLQGQTNVSVPVENVMEAIASLSDREARNFLVANLPDLGRLPATRSNGRAADLTALTQVHNQRLEQRIQQLKEQQPDLDIVLLDVFSLYNEAIANPDQFGLANVTGTCLSGMRSCANPSQFLFWDGIHPSTAGHQLVAEAAYTQLQQVGVASR